jgi:hypothetical protein
METDERKIDQRNVDENLYFMDLDIMKSLTKVPASLLFFDAAIVWGTGNTVCQKKNDIARWMINVYRWKGHLTVPYSFL